MKKSKPRGIDLPPWTGDDPAMLKWLVEKLFAQEIAEADVAQGRQEKLDASKNAVSMAD